MTLGVTLGAACCQIQLNIDFRIPPDTAGRLPQPQAMFVVQRLQAPVPVIGRQHANLPLQDRAAVDRVSVRPPCRINLGVGRDPVADQPIQVQARPVAQTPKRVVQQILPDAQGLIGFHLMPGIPLHIPLGLGHHLQVQLVGVFRIVSAHGAGPPVRRQGTGRDEPVGDDPLHLDPVKVVGTQPVADGLRN